MVESFVMVREKGPGPATDAAPPTAVAEDVLVGTAPPARAEDVVVDVVGKEEDPSGDGLPEVW